MLGRYILHCGSISIVGELGKDVKGHSLARLAAPVIRFLVAAEDLIRAIGIWFSIAALYVACVFIRENLTDVAAGLATVIFEAVVVERAYPSVATAVRVSFWVSWVTACGIGATPQEGELLQNGQSRRCLEEEERRSDC